VYGFEPNPTPFALLEARFADVPEVVTLPYGLGARDETLPLELAGPGSSLHGTVDGGGPAVEVEIRDAVSAFSELGLDRIDLLKVNIEGAEYDLLDHLLAAGVVPRIRYLLVQFHEWHPGAHGRRRAIRRALGRTHEVVWDHPWIFELWCDRSRPHPPPPPVDDALRAAIVAEVEARRAAAGPG
jgi:FkbM family methyltransferase